MGLFDINMSTPEGEGFNNALMQAAAMLLTPRARGGGIGSAFAAMPQAIQQAQAQAQRNRLMGLQEQQLGMEGQKLRDQMEEKSRQREALTALLADPRFANDPSLRALAGVAPDKAIDRAFPAPVKPTFGKIYQNGREQPAWLAPGQPPQPVGDAAPPNMNQYLIPDGKGGWMPNQAFINAKQSVAAAGAGKNSITMVQEPAEAKKVGEYYGTQFADIQKAGLDATGKINRLDRMGQLLSGLETGKFTPAMTEFKSALDSLGIKIDPNLGSAQAAQALSNELALQMRNPSGGAGMPGAMSDADRNFLQQTVPSLSKTPEGNRIMLETAKRLAKRDQQVAKLARDYRAQKGHLDEGFFTQLQSFSEANPLFSDMPAQQTATPQPMPATGALPPGWSIKERK